MWIIKVSTEGTPVFFEGFQGADNQHVGTPKAGDAMKFNTRIEAEAFIKANGLTWQAQAVLNF